MPMPETPKIYHIVHVDKLASIINDGWLWCDSEISRRRPVGTTIGMGNIKQRRMTLPVNSHPGLHVGDCVPFYFSPRSIMLYLISQRNHPDLSYKDGQDPIVHFEVDLYQTVNWAQQNNARWAFTLSNAGSCFFEDRNNLAQLNEIDWDAVQSTDWRSCKEGKQAEFLVERQFPWQLIQRIGVLSRPTYDKVRTCVAQIHHRPQVDIASIWYY